MAPHTEEGERPGKSREGNLRVEGQEERGETLLMQTQELEHVRGTISRSLGQQTGAWPRAELGNVPGFNRAVAGERHRTDVPEQGHKTTEGPRWRDKKVGG